MNQRFSISDPDKARIYISREIVIFYIMFLAVPVVVVVVVVVVFTVKEERRIMKWKERRRVSIISLGDKEHPPNGLKFPLYLFIYLFIYLFF